jgi:hypothetical protein
MNRELCRGAFGLVIGVLILAACSSYGPSDGIAYLNSLTAPSNSPQARGWRSLSAEYQGELHPAENVRSALAGNTILFSHPWVRQDMRHVQENGIYFDSNGTADSLAWANRPWQVSGNTVCAIGSDEKSCFKLYTDDAGHAFLFSEELDVLSLVTAIRPGDTLQMATRYEERIQAEQQDKAQEDLLTLGILTGAMTQSSGRSGGSDLLCADGSRPGPGGCGPRGSIGSSSGSVPDTSIGCAIGDRAFGTCR